MKISIKREQNQASLSFAERLRVGEPCSGMRKKFRPKVKQKRLLLLLALLMTAATGAWAQTSDKATPLTLQATDNGWIYIYHPKVNMQYKVGDGDKQTVTGTDNVAINVTEGQTVQFFGNGTSITAYGVEQGSNYTQFDSSVPCYIYGNIMSLVNEDGFAGATELTADYAFYLLFAGFSNLSNHPSRKLVLPATTLTKRCYSDMFIGCTGLTTAPALPATKLAEQCYSDMFGHCTGLTTAPALPATELATKCYYTMFQKCTSLTTAPLLPAPTLAKGCYSNMFNGCTNLKAVTCLATNISAEGATSNWLKGVAATGTLTIAKWMEDKWAEKPTISGIPSGWTTDVYSYKVKLADGTADAGNWTATVGTSTTPQSLPVEGLSNDDDVTLTYGGRLKVKSVTATTDAATAGPTYNERKRINDGPVTVAAGEHWLITGTGTQTSNTITIADGATVTLYGVNISSSSYCIKCAGNATIILKDGSTNTLTGTGDEYPALWAGDANTTLTIQGATGVLNVTSGDFCAGIGGGYKNTNKTCGNITIEGGVITAQGGSCAPGIGSDKGEAVKCGNITITNGVTKVTAKKGGEEAPYSIGASDTGSCGTIIIDCTLDTNGNPVGGTKYWENNAAVNEYADSYLRQATIIFPEPPFHARIYK